jgi:molybdate transport system ATP-binding protein
MSATLDLNLVVPLDRYELRATWRTTGTRLGLFGPSGSGKTTLLEAITGWRAVASGTIRVDGETWFDSAAGVNMSPQRRGVGYVPQDLLLFPHLTVLGNLLSGNDRAKSSETPAPSLEKVLDVLDLGPLRDRPARQLSGGEQRRVALGRALLSGARLLLLDEPLSGLDLPLRSRILHYLLRAQGEFRIPTVHVSHDSEELRVVAEEVVILEAGAVVRQGMSEQVFGPAETRVNMLLGRVVALEGDCARVSIGTQAEILVPGDRLEAGQQVTVAFSAEDVLIATSAPDHLSAQNRLLARIDKIGSHGSETSAAIVLELSSASVSASLAACVTRQACDELGLRPGLVVHLVWKARSCRVLLAGSVDAPRRNQ